MEEIGSHCYTREALILQCKTSERKSWALSKKLPISWWQGTLFVPIPVLKLQIRPDYDLNAPGGPGSKITFVRIHKKKSGQVLELPFFSCNIFWFFCFQFLLWFHKVFEFQTFCGTTRGLKDFPNFFKVVFVFNSNQFHPDYDRRGVLCRTKSNPHPVVKWHTAGLCLSQRWTTGFKLELERRWEIFILFSKVQKYYLPFSSCGERNGGEIWRYILMVRRPSTSLKKQQRQVFR